MKILTIGSWRGGPIRGTGWKFKESRDSYINACKRIGKKIVTSGYTISVCSDGKLTTDRCMVEGIIELVENNKFAPIRTPVIDVYGTENTDDIYGTYMRKHPHLFRLHPQTEPNWSSTHLSATDDSDLILVIGGRNSTYTSGLASLIAKKKVIPVGSFGGAGEKLLNTIEGMPDYENKEEMRKLRGPWTDFTFQSLANLIDIYATTKVLIIHGRSNDWQDLKILLTSSLPSIEPVVMREEFGNGKTLPEKFEYLAAKVNKAIALATPDDVGNFVEEKTPGNFRARQNVWLEVGWLWGALGRKNIMILSSGNVEVPSDLYGLELYLYKKSPTELREKINRFLQR
jgi:hypothetical protein